MEQEAGAVRSNKTNGVSMVLIVCLAAGFLLMPAANRAQDSQVSDSTDGSYWAKLPNLAKATYVGGYRSGYTNGFFASMALLQRDTKAVTDEDMQKELHLAFRGGSSSNGDVARQVDLIYSDYRNTPVCISHAIFDAAVSLEGISVETNLADERKKDAGNCHTN